MKHIAVLVPVMALLAVSPAPALPGNGRAAGPDYFLADHGSANVIAGRPQNLKNALILLRTEAVKIQVDDGGTLTAEHRIYLQTKLDGLTGKRVGRLRDL